MIDREIQNSSKETPGLIMAKMNSLADKDIIEALYKASNAHVNILLNIRGICLIVPGVKGQSENISVVSIVDRYLEHARVLYFQNNGEEELYLASADWMPRNLEKRVELMFPIIQEDIFKTLKDNLLVYFSDNTNSYYLQSNGSWVQRKKEEQEERMRAQEFLYNQFHHAYEAQIKELPKEFIVRRTEPK
jgi:polyphosphate kinase